MLTRISVLLMVVVLALAVVACGEDEEPANGGQTTTEETTPEPEATEATEEETPETGGTGGADVADEQIQAAIESCKSSVQAQAGQLSEEVRADLEDICDQIETGDADEIRELTIDVCVRVAEETVPDGTARQQVIDACEQAAP